jgi:hypothetical protein
VKLPPLALAPLALAALGLVACLTAYNRYKWTALDGAPVVEPRAEGCHVDVFEDGQKVDRPHAELGSLVMEFPQSKLKEQGPEGAIKTLKAAACENGAFIIKDLRALSTGAVDKGLVYEGTLATLLGDDGQPINLRRTDAGPASDPVPPAAGGW